MTPVEVERAITARVAELIVGRGAPMPGALEAVDLLSAPRRSRWRCARAPTPWSSRPPSGAWASSRRSPCWHSAEWEPLGKPHPGAYLSTAAKLGVDPTGCLAVEDSFNGAIAAKAARMRVVVVPEPAALDSPRWGFCDAVLRLAGRLRRGAAAVARAARPVVRRTGGLARRRGADRPRDRRLREPPETFASEPPSVPIHLSRGAFPGQGGPSDVGPQPEAGRWATSLRSRSAPGRQHRWRPVARHGGGFEHEAALVACARGFRRISRLPARTVRIGVLASGSGTILEAILAAGLPGPPGDRRPPVPRPRGGRGRRHPRRAGRPGRLRRVRAGVRPRRLHRGRSTEALVAAGVDVVAMAGFGTVLGQPIHDAFPGRILNTHPALLPAFPGWHAVRDALAAGVTETGTTVHVATLEMDAGPILAQAAVPVLPERHRGDPARADQGGRADALSRDHPHVHRRAGGDGRGWARITAGGRTMRALLSVYDKTGLGRPGPRAFRSGLGAGLQRRDLGGPGRGRHRPRRGGRPDRRPRDARRPGQDPPPRPSTAASWPTGPSPSTSPTSTGQGIELIDLVVCNLYPFSSDPSIELIDVGGPTMVRAAAKNHDHVGVVVDPGGLRGGPRRAAARRLAVARHPAAPGPRRLRPHRRLRRRHRRVARRAGAPTGRRPSPGRSIRRRRPAAPTIHLTLERAGSLRYGENPHQHGARYRIVGQHSWWDDVVQHGGKELSYLNIFDADAAWRLVHELAAPAPARPRSPSSSTPTRAGRPSHDDLAGPTSGPSSATRSRPSAASWPSAGR